MTSNSNKTDEGGQSPDGVVLHGYHKKLKTMKKKYFVLYDECEKSPARLEYFDNEKKFKSKTSPKRTIILNSCFNINRRLDTKHEFVVTLSTEDGGFGIVMDTEEDMNKWLRAMLKLQNGQNIFSGPPRPYYEHVWQVSVQRKGLAEKKGILGSYHVCLSSKSVTLIRIGNERTNIGEARVQLIEFYLTSIRRCGDSKCYFYMEVGRHSAIGAGELWMETKDSLIAQNMHTMILNVMSSSADDPYGPMRKRSSSATESTKPVTILQRRQTHSGSKTMNSSSPLSVPNRDRCDSLPSSRNRTTTESSFGNASMPPSRTMSSLNTVPNSNYNRHSHSPPMNSNALSPSVGCSESDESTLSIDETDSIKHSLTPDESAGFVPRFYNSRSPGGVIPEENSDEFWYAENKKQNSSETASILDKLNMHSGAIIENKKTLSCSSNIHAEEAESQYMDMFSSISPFETALCDTNLAAAECPFKSCNDSSDGNSRASSLAEEVVDGYVNMSPQTYNDYVDMEQSLKSRRQIYNLSLSSRNMITGVPWKEMSFAEYPIEKVSSRILPDEDELQHLNERPPRAYSVGSRMEHNNQKLRIEVITNTDQNNCRVRAFSVGSRSKVPRCDLQRNILLTANSGSSNNSNVSNSKTSIASIEPTSESAVRGRKSSSAPLLIHKSQNSVDRMDDLMEIDFSKNSSSRSNSLSSQSPSGSSYLKNTTKGSHLRSGILSTSPGQSAVHKKSHDSGSSYLKNTPKGNQLRSSILSTSPGQSAVHKKSHDSFSEPSETDNGYLEMRPVIYSHSKVSNDESADHFLVPNDNAVSNLSESRSQQQEPEPTHNNKLKMDEWSKIETPEGYLEMSWNGNKDGPDQISNKTRSQQTWIDIKKSRGVTKMPSIPACQTLINNRNLATSNNSKLSMLQAQNQAAHFNQKSAINILAKPESSQRKRFFDHVNSSFTISEEKIQPDPDISEKFKNLFIKLSKQSTDVVSNVQVVQVDLSTADPNCYDYTNFCSGVSKEMCSKRIEVDTSQDRENPKDIESKPNAAPVPVQCIKTNNKSYSKDEELDNYCILQKNKLCKSASSNQEDSTSEDGSKFARKSNSPKCTPTSPYSSSLRCHRVSNSNRQTKGTGYELLHICSDSSLQTRKNLSRPSSVNSDSNSSLETTPQCRPNSVNSDCLQSNSVSSSTATLCFSPKICDNRSQDALLTIKPVPITNNAYNEDNKQKQQHIAAANELTSSPASKIVALCQPSSNTQLELHYASLDLPISSTKNSNTTMYGSIVNPAKFTPSDDTATSLSPNSNTSQQSAFTYAKIDFNQCENKKFKCGTQNNL